GIAYFSNRTKQADARIVGTLPYMSPEQLLGGRLDNRSDLYSLGVIAYEWLSGIRPLRPHGATLLDQVRDLATRAPAPLSENRPAVPESVESLVMELLAKTPRQRPASAVEIANRCNRLVTTFPANPK
ncbi:MAG TPA: protein kinase, partial [Planctomycetaceae bacterium]|nr:protein kinase [Planctomycetaceae bacterium]